MPLWHCYVLRTLTGTGNIGLIRDEDYVAAPRRGLRVDWLPLSEKLVDTVDLS